MRYGTFALALAGMGLSTPALACGGFFCSQEPMDQSEERIVFAVDEENGTVDAHIQIFYEGVAKEFAWVVPVQAIPELFVSTDQLFQVIQWQTDPQFWLEWKEEGTCEWDDWGFYDVALESDDGDSAGGNGQDEGVIVVDQAQVGPYDTVTLQASDADALIDWLQDNNYDLPDDLTPVLANYIDETGYFVALRLSNDKDAGDITPLGMRYEANKPSIPIVLTSIAAVPDMRLQVTIFGSERFVPESYLHVQINEAAIDWLNYGSNYEDVISQAADEAGGHAFATDFAGDASAFQGWLYQDGMFDLDVLRATVNPAQYVDRMLGQGFPRNTAVQNIIRTYIEMPQELIDDGVDESEFYNCLECFDSYLDDIEFDPDAMTDALDELIVQPLIVAESLYDHAWMSRMTSSLDAVEMDVDPVFVANSDMESVSNQHNAVMVFECGDTMSISEAPRRIELSDGTVIRVPPLSWFEANPEEAAEFMDELGATAAAVIEETGSTGQPTVVVDNSSAIAADIAAHNARFGLPSIVNNGCSGCGVIQSERVTGVVAVLWLLVGVVGLRRKKCAPG